MAARLQGDPEERKKKIARAACAAILTHGLHKVNMRDIAKALGTTTGPLQHYFANKDELLLYTKNLLIDELLEDARQASLEHAGTKRLQVMCERLLPSTAEARAAWLVLTAFNGRAISDSDLTQIQVSRYSKCRAFFSKALAAAKSTGAVKKTVDVELEAVALASFVDGLAVQMLFLNTSEAQRLKSKLIRQYLKRAFAP